MLRCPVLEAKRLTMMPCMVNECFFEAMRPQLTAVASVAGMLQMNSRVPYKVSFS